MAMSCGPDNIVLSARAADLLGDAAIRDAYLDGEQDAA
jgi:hypothetical protein